MNTKENALLNVFIFPIFDVIGRVQCYLKKTSATWQQKVVHKFILKYYAAIFQYRAKKKKKNADQYSPESHIKVTRIKEIFFVILYYYYYYYYIIILLNEMYRLEKGEYAYWC